MNSYCYVYIFLLLCIFRSEYSVSLCCSVYCLCVNVTVLLPLGVNTIAVNIYIICHIYHIIADAVHWLPVQRSVMNLAGYGRN